MTNHSPLRDRNCADAVDLLYKNSFGGHVINYMTSSALVFGFVNDEIQHLKLIWWAVITLVVTLRLLDSCHWTFYVNRQIPIEKAPKYRLKFISAAFLTAIIWAIYPIFTFHHMDLVEFTSTVIIFASMAGGGATILSADKLLARTYCLFMLLPLVILAITSGEYVMQLLGGMGVFYAAVMVVTAIKSTEFTGTAIHLKNENADLLIQVNKEKEYVKRINEKLKSTLNELNNTNENLESEVNKRTEQIMTLSRLDSLTGLLNRGALIESITAKVQKGINQYSAFSVLFIDLNHFKKVNDTLGHEVGDEVLRRVAACLSEFSNQAEIGRWGGDEFVVLLELPMQDTRISDGTMALNLANKILHQIRYLPNVGRNGFKVDASIGISHFPKDSIDAEELIRMADIAMFEQKRAGAIKPAEFEISMFEKMDRIESLRRGLSEAVAKEQFHLVFQPIVDNENNVYYFEALLRWTWHNKLVSPVEFIPIAEQSGSISQIGEWVLTEACKAAANWRNWSNAGVSVNVSTLQLLDENFVSVVKNALKISGLAPQRLNLEITETVFCDDVDLARDKLIEVCELGVSCAIDDFGIGYSSLAQIDQFPVHCIKVDRHFVANLEGQGASILRATQLMGRELGLKIVAEGLETAEQVNMLKKMGIDLFQGYYFAKPIPQDSVDDYLQEQNYQDLANTQHSGVNG